MAALTLVAASDDYLLEQGVREAVAKACQALGGVTPEYLAEEIAAEGLALELGSPSLFNPQRVLVVTDARRWVEAPLARGAAKLAAGGDLKTLVEVLEDGLPDDLALVLGAWCGAKPKGSLVKVVEERGSMVWIPVPPAPKPWEDVVLSEEQKTALRKVLRRAAPEVRFAPAAEQLLLERLGFTPRQLASEAQKLAAGSQDGQVDEDLVRQLTFPRERSLEVVRDAVLGKDGKALFDLIGAAAGGVPLRDWRGQRLDPGSLPVILIAQVANLLEQLLCLRRIATAAGIAAQMEPEKTAARAWYPRTFRDRLAPDLIRRLGQTSAWRGKVPTPWTLGQLFSAAGRYGEDQLIAALAAVGELEARVRGPLALEAVSAWLARLFVGSRHLHGNRRQKRTV